MSDQPKPTAADQPPSGKDAIPDRKKPCLCNDICIGKEQLHSNRVCQFDLGFPAVPQEAIAPSGEVERLRAEIRKWIDSGCTPPPSPQELAWYACTSCNARCVKLWREPHGGKVLKCAACLSPDKPVDERGQQPTEHGQTTDQVNYWLPAVPIGDTFYGYSSVPPQCVGWWKGLPTYDAIAQERHQAEVYRKQMVEAEATVAMLKDELAEYRVKYHGSDKAWAWAVVDPRSHLRNADGDKVDMLICWDHDDALSFQEDALEHREEGDEREPVEIVSLFPDATHWKQRAETAEAELARHPVSIAEANELQDILRTLTNSGTALKTSARELVSAWIRQAHEIDDLRGKLNDTNERLAKVREAIQDRDQRCKDGMYARDSNNVCVLHVRAALAEGEH